jgi:hypothetical protein
MPALSVINAKTVAHAVIHLVACLFEMKDTLATAARLQHVWRNFGRDGKLAVDWKSVPEFDTPDAVPAAGVSAACTTLDNVANVVYALFMHSRDAGLPTELQLWTLTELRGCASAIHSAHNAMPRCGLGRMFIKRASLTR